MVIGAWNGAAFIRVTLMRGNTLSSQKMRKKCSQPSVILYKFLSSSVETYLSCLHHQFSLLVLLTVYII